ncbi:MAG: hypothetical protein ACEPOW_14600 [Bacteroidales bacterium]
MFAIVFSGRAAMVFSGYIKATQSDNFIPITYSENIMHLKAHGAIAFIMILLFLMHHYVFVKHLEFTEENTLKRIS